MALTKARKTDSSQNGLIDRKAGRDALLSVVNIKKAFGTNQVLKGISLKVCPGEVLALIGGNGAGKSTLMKIIMGIYSADAGEVLINNVKVDINNPKAALEHSIYMVPQEPMLFPNMTVRENITIGLSAKQDALNKQLDEIMKMVGWDIDLNRKAQTLSIAEQGIVEILRGLLRDPEVLILDEPTSALAFDEVEALFKSIRELSNKGIGIIYITHRLAEVFEISNTVAILRDGVVTMQGPTENFSRDDLVQGLLPPDISEARCSVKHTKLEIDRNQAPTLELKSFSGYGFENVSFKIYPGEIVGLAGVVGAGRTEMATTIFGRDKVLGGQVLLEGKDITAKSTKQVIAQGVQYVPEDRFRDGLFRIRDVEENTTSSLLFNQKLGKLFLKQKEAETISQSYVDNFRTKVTSIHQEVGGLSGGNQQKIVIGRAFATDPKLVILDEPTRGIDAAARGDVYAVLQELRNRGVSILLISSDMEEIVELSDRALTMYCGRINGEFTGDSITLDKLMSSAFGVTSAQCA